MSAKVSGRCVPKSPFGDKTWLDVRVKVELFLKSRFSGLSDEERSDILGEVMVDLIGYWQGLQSSVTNDIGKNFAFAVRRGRWRASSEARAVLQYNLSEIPSSGWNNHHEVGGESPGEGFDSGEDGHQTPFEWLSERYWVPSPEELIEDDDLAERARQGLAQLPEEELRDWCEHLLTGASQRECARKLGITQRAFQCRQQVRRRRVLARAKQWGLVA